jgi:hypothetical protein
MSEAVELKVSKKKPPKRRAAPRSRESGRRASRPASLAYGRTGVGAAAPTVASGRRASARAGRTSPAMPMFCQRNVHRTIRAIARRLMVSFLLRAHGPGLRTVFSSVAEWAAEEKPFA